MKKCAIVFVVTLVAVTVGVSADAIFVENHSLEQPGTGKPNWSEIPGWEATDNRGGAETGWGPTDGVYTAFMENGCQAYNLTDHTIAGGMEYTLTLDVRRTWWGDAATVDLYYDDNGNRVPMASKTIEFPDQGTTDMEEHTITVKSDDVPNSIGKKLGIQVTCGEVGVGSGGWIGFDNVRLEGTSLIVIPIHPLPGDTLVPVDDDLEWEVVNNWNVDLYFQANEPNFSGVAPVLTDTSDTTYEPGTMDPDTMYYWRADAYEPNTVGTGIGFIVHTGPVWSFRTAPATPTITLNPISQTVAVGSEVVLTIDGTNIATAQWYKDGAPLAGETGLTLTISDVQVGDEGYYHCVASNAAGDDTSDAARLLTRRLAGWWKLDGNLDDSVGEVVAGAPAHPGSGIDPVVGIPAEPNYVPSGADAGAIDFRGDDRIVTIDDSGEYFNFYRLGQTVSGWVKTNTAGWDGVISKHRRWDTWAGWVIDVNGGWAHVTLRGSHEDLWGTDDDEDMFDGDWHLVTAVMDPDTNTSRFYVDGKLRSTSGGYTLGSALLNAEPVVFGAEAANGVIPYIGMLDDVRIWTYALDDIAIALLYTDFNPGSEICVGNPDNDVAGPDGVPDCRVNLYDLAQWATEWLECNIVPTCIP